MRAAPQAVPPRREPFDEDERHAAGPEQEHRQREPVRDRAGEVVRAVEAQSRQRTTGRPQREPKRVGAVDHQPVHPQGHHAVQPDGQCEHGDVDCKARLRGRVAALAEVAAPGDERDDGKPGDDRAVVKAALDVQRKQRRQQCDGDLPAASAAARGATGGDHERERERRHEGLRQTVNVRGVE
jgi:hypothetical protein